MRTVFKDIKLYLNYRQGMNGEVKRLSVLGQGVRPTKLRCHYLSWDPGDLDRS